MNAVDLAYLAESFGLCPSTPPGAIELFDEVVVIDATVTEAYALGLIVTHVYATGSAVGPGDARLVVHEAAINVSVGTTFFQHPLGGNVAPPSSIIPALPNLAYDTFVTFNRLVDGDLTTTGIEGSWLPVPTTPEREAVDIGHLTGTPGQHGVLIAQITLEGLPGTSLEYGGPLRLYTSTRDGGTLLGAPAVVHFALCNGDVNRDRVVDVLDLLVVLAAWGPCPGCPEDVYNDGVVDVQDPLLVLTNWGPCP